MTDKVEVKVQDVTVEVEPRFYDVAHGLLTMGFPIMDVFQPVEGEGIDEVGIVFADGEDFEQFADFLLVHRMFPGAEGRPEVHGSVMMERVDGELSATYFLYVPFTQFSELEACVAAHVPAPPMTN